MLGAAAAALAFGSTAMAQAPAAAAPPAPAYTFSFNGAYSTDYIFRGLSQTSGKGAASGGADFVAGMVYAGVWASQVDFGATAGDPSNSTQFEYDLYGGFRPALGPVNLDIGVIRYGYTSSPTAAHYEYYEGKLAGTYATGPNTLGGAFYYSPEFFGKTGAAQYYEINDAFTLSNKATLSGAVGYQALDKKKAGINGYTQYNFGVTYPVTDHFGVDVRFWGTDSKATSLYTKTFAGDRFVLTLKAAF